jgi:hypothetical protein
MEIYVLRQAVLALKGPSLQYSTVHGYMREAVVEVIEFIPYWTGKS